MKRDIAQEVTDRIIEAIESGQTGGKWVCPWDTTAGLPLNAFDRKPYRGINTLLLWGARTDNQYTSNRWATFKRWQSEGYKLEDAKGRGVHIIFWKWLEKENEETGEVDRFPVQRSFVVFNADHARDIETGQPFTEDQAGEDEASPAFDWWDGAEDIIAATGADIRHQGHRACYVPARDEVYMPPRSSFYTLHGYYSTMFHELAHWTGHASRLNRKLHAPKVAKDARAVEELVAELSAAFTCAHIRMTPEPRPDHAQYIESWLQVLRNDKTAILKAAGKAIKATDYIIHGGQAQASAAA